MQGDGMVDPGTLIASDAPMGPAQHGSDSIFWVPFQRNGLVEQFCGFDAVSGEAIPEQQPRHQARTAEA